MSDESIQFPLRVMEDVGHDSKLVSDPYLADKNGDALGVFELRTVALQAAAWREVLKLEDAPEQGMFLWQRHLAQAWVKVSAASGYGAEGDTTEKEN